jgi:hypothetical protein
MSGTTYSRFFWADWRSDPCLRTCSLAARGLWMDMLCIAAEAQPTGYVLVNGRTLTATDLARLTGAPEADVRTSLAELEAAGVYSRDRTGRIYSRRMVRDWKQSQINRQNGAKGGNPTLWKNTGNSGSVNPPDNGSVNPRLKPQGHSQEPREVLLESKTQDSVAPLPRARAHEGGTAETEPDTPTGGSKAERRDAGERDAPAAEEPPLTDEERAERVRRLDEVVASLRGGKPKAAAMHDPVAYQRAVKDAKRDAWLKDLHGWVGGRLAGDARMQAWEAIHTAREAGARDATPSPVRKLIDQLDKLHKREQLHSGRIALGLEHAVAAE